MAKRRKESTKSGDDLRNDWISSGLADGSEFKIDLGGHLDPEARKDELEALKNAQEGALQHLKAMSHPVMAANVESPTTFDEVADELT